jgi:hypothetical protein
MLFCEILTFHRLLRCSLTVIVPPGKIGAEVKDQRRLVTYNSTDERIRIKIDIDSVYLLDGQPWKQIFSPSSFNMQPETSIELTLYSSLSMCPTDTAYWSHAIYDPSLSTLFVGDPSPPPGSPESKGKSGLTTGQIAVIATVIPIVVILAAFVIVATKVPSVRRIFFKAEQKLGKQKEERLPTVATAGAPAATASSSTTNPEDRGSWTKSQRPSV